MAYRTAVVALVFGVAIGLVCATFAPFKIFIPGLLQGAMVTVEVAIAGAAIAVLAAATAALAKLYAPFPLSWIAVVYIEVFRGTSLLVQLFWMYFVLPHFGVSLSPMAAAIITIGLSYGAYGAELVRGAVLAVPRGQWEAVRALNMSLPTALRRIILPQAFVAMIPPWGNLLIELLKGTSLVSLVTIADLTFRAQEMNQTTFRTVEIFGLVFVVYLALAAVTTAGVRALEAKVGPTAGRGR